MKSLLRDLWQVRRARIGALVLLTFCLLALLAPWIARVGPSEPVGAAHEPPSAEHWLGTTEQGQDVFAQLVWGARATLPLGFAVGAASIAIGALVGVAGAIKGGLVDAALALATNVFLVLPGLPLAVVAAAYLPPGTMTLAAVLILTGWAWNARVLRQRALQLRQSDFVLAAIISGESLAGLVWREVAPNLLPQLISAFISATLYAISASVGLEFLGLGDLSRATWGTNLYWAANDAALLVGAWWTFVPTGLAVALVGLSLSLINTALDLIAHPRLRAEDEAARALRSRGLAKGTSTPVLHG